MDAASVFLCHCEEQSDVAISSLRSASAAEMEGFDRIMVSLRSSPQQADVHRTSAYKMFKSLFHSANEKSCP